MKHLVVIAAMGILCLNVAAQTHDTEEAKYYYANKNERVNLSILNEKLVIAQKVYEKKMYNAPLSVGAGNDRVYEWHFSKVSNLKASISIPNKKGKFKQTTLGNFQKKANFSGSTFYGDNNYYEIEYPNVQAGSYSELSYDLKINDPHFLTRFFFTENVPVEQATYTILADDKVELGWEIYGRQKAEIQFAKKSEFGKTQYTWTLKSAKPILSESNGPGFLFDASHIVVYIKNYHTKEKTKAVLNNPQDLLNWYQSLLERIEPLADQQLVETTQTITEGANSELEKAKRIFHWVQDHIRYIAIEDGWRGFIPFPADEILEKRYGDCKDMTHLMYEMMKIAGIKAEHTWIGTRKLPYTYNETPCLSVDNHLVLSIFIDGKRYVLDATDAHTPFGIPSTFILSKEGLSKNEKGQLEIYKIPEFKAEDCVIKNEIQLQANGDLLVGKGTKIIETFEYSDFQHTYGNANVEQDEVLADYLELGQNNFELLEHQISDEEPRAKGRFDYSFKVPDYVKSFGESSYINLNVKNEFVADVLQADRQSAFKIDYKTKTDNTVEFTLPEGKSVVELPAAKQARYDVGSYATTYEIQGNKVIYNRVITVDKLLIEPEDFEQWNAFLKELLTLYSTTIEYK